MASISQQTSAKLLLLLTILLFSTGCGVLLKERYTKHNGVENKEKGIPLIIYKSINPIHTRRLVVMLSGDGGWQEFNDKLAMHFSRRRFNTIGFNSRSYFWNKRTPEETTSDIVYAIVKYNKNWKADRIILCGYSFGADVMPFIYNRLPKAIKDKVVAIQLLSPFLSTDFDVHMGDILGTGVDNRDYKVGEEIRKIVDIPIYCFYGKDEYPKSLEDLKQKNFSITILPGDHHYKDAFVQIVNSLR
ncbi:MAG: hypothetical protein JWQ25_1244 [Daejeonella sp.]|nr:hypothetical protein [Daejeonella sp.]